MLARSAVAVSAAHLPDTLDLGTREPLHRLSIGAMMPADRTIAALSWVLPSRAARRAPTPGWRP